MRLPFAATILALARACAPEPSAAVRTLAERLAFRGGASLSEESRARYVACGIKALSPLPAERLEAASEALDAPSIWAILGGDALDAYVKACREADLKAGLRSQK